MAVRTIDEPTAAQAQRIAVNKVMRASNSYIVPVDQKIVVVVMGVTPGTTPSDYAAMSSTITSNPNIQAVELLLSGKTPETVDEGEQLRLVVDAQVREEDIPEEE